MEEEGRGRAMEHGIETPDGTAQPFMLKILCIAATAIAAATTNSRAVFIVVCLVVWRCWLAGGPVTASPARAGLVDKSSSKIFHRVIHRLTQTDCRRACSPHTEKAGASCRAYLRIRPLSKWQVGVGGPYMGSVQLVPGARLVCYQANRRP